MTPAIKGSCQICGRPIGIKTGLIAHHGYQRPGHGWQTASCFGARYRPLEVACDAIEGAITSLRRYIETRSAHLVEMQASPPDALDRRDAWGKAVRSYPRPERFDAAACLADICGKPGYHGQYRARIADLRGQIKAAGEDIATLTARLASWAPAEAA